MSAGFRLARDDESGDLVDATGDLAHVLGWDVVEVAERLGAPWWGAAGPDEPTGDDDLAPWFFAGDPFQVMLAVTSTELLVARPRGLWSGGTHALRWAPDAVERVDRLDLDGLEGALRRAAHRRRRSLRWCRYCRAAHPPELQLGNTCHDCASRWEGVVF